MRLNSMAVMTTALAACAFLLLATALGGPAGASEIYKWTDAEGNVHYGDRPDGAKDATRLAIASRPTDPARIQADAAARHERQNLAREAAAEPHGPTKEELRAQAKERADNCAKYRARLETFIQSRRLYKEDEKGERVYLDEAETQAARTKVQHQVEENCSP